MKELPRHNRFIELVDFILWCQSRRTGLTWQMIADKFGVSRATAFRMLAAYNDLCDARPVRLVFNAEAA